MANEKIIINLNEILTLNLINIVLLLYYYKRRYYRPIRTHTNLMVLQNFT